MPGSYAHITLVNTLRLPRLLDGMPRFSSDARSALSTFFRYCELGSVSPDYPYLTIESSDAKKWADNMHYYGVGDMIKIGIREIKDMQGDQRDLCLAWLLGFAAHVGADVTIHPVVESIVGDYDHHATEHRVCEMNQDVYIFKRMNLGGVELADHLETGIQKCEMTRIEELWGRMLAETHPDEYKTNRPDFTAWHKHFEPLVEDVAAHGYRLCIFGRHALTDRGFLYPNDNEIDEVNFIHNLPTPEGAKDYDTIFDYAVDNVGLLWQDISAGVFDNSEGYLSAFGNWNLDKGVAQQEFLASGHGKYIFWEATL